jgi:hypothetical protein
MTYITWAYGPTRPPAPLCQPYSGAVGANRWPAPGALMLNPVGYHNFDQRRAGVACCGYAVQVQRIGLASIKASSDPITCGEIWSASRSVYLLPPAVIDCRMSLVAACCYRLQDDVRVVGPWVSVKGLFPFL